MTSDRTAKSILNDHFARIGKALANPHRVELLDLLAQGERSVEVLSAETEMSIALTSSHLQGLRAARLVENRREGSRVFYRLAGDDVYRLLSSLREVARMRLADVNVALDTHLRPLDMVEALTREELVDRVRSGAVVVLDVRPAQEYAAGHIDGARSIPLDQLEARLGELLAGVEIVAYCRGPYCLYAPAAVNLLRDRGYRARRLVDGFPEWRLAGLPVASGTEG